MASAWKAITDQLGQPDHRWPKHHGHLTQIDRFRLVGFLFVNDVPPPIVRQLASSNQIFLRDAKAKKHWDNCVDVFMAGPVRLQKYSSATYYNIRTEHSSRTNGSPRRAQNI